MTVIVATGGLVMVSARAFDCTEPEVAVIVTAPGATPVTFPLASTVAIRLSLDVRGKGLTSDHVSARIVRDRLRLERLECEQR